jgi:hypothetical protein
MTDRFRLVALAALGIVLVVAARWQLPQAPPMFEGAFVPPPFRYCSPPKDLASTNSPPAGGQADLPSVSGVNKLGTAESGDPGGAQLVAFFAQGVFRTNEVVHIRITPRCSGAPAPPPNSTLVGNDYQVLAYTGSRPDQSPPPALQTPAQVLLRVPPVAYNTIRVYFDGGWHDTQFGAQTDLVNISLDHLGDIAAFNDTSLQAPAKTPPSFNYVSLFEAALIVIAVLIITAGIIAQRRRSAAVAPRGGRGKPTRASRK